jgi:spore maturation protein A
VATNSMCLFLTINTAGLHLSPASMIGLMASAGSKDPTAIIGTTVAATVTGLVVGVTVAKLLEGMRFFSVARAVRAEDRS